jgi:UDP-glucose 4-epimerase
MKFKNVSTYNIMANKPTIMLTGATGFIGSHLLESLLENKYSVIILKRSSSDTWRINHLMNSVNFYDLDKQPLSQIFEENTIDIIVHLAAFYRKNNNVNDIADMVHSNITFPTELLEYGINHGIKGFINTGTCFEYNSFRQPMCENTTESPFNFYAKTKLAFECILKTHSEQCDINTFRLFFPFGERDNHKLVPMIIQKALANETIDLSEGLQKIDLIYVKDIVSVYIKAIDRILKKKNHAEYHTFNIGFGYPLSIRDILSIIEEVLKKRINVNWGAISNDAPIIYANIEKARIFFNWYPLYTPKEGIINTISYYKEKNAQKKY